MTTTWTAIDAKLDLFLDDAERADVDRLFPLALRVEAWNWAQDLLCYHTPRALSMAMEIDTGERSVVLPGDFFAMHGVYDADREQWWRPIDLLPGDVQYTDEDLPEYWMWGNQLFLEDEITYNDANYTLYYWAYWPKIEYTVGDDISDLTYEQEVIFVPRWAELALIHLTTATCMMPLEIFAADLNQYKIKIESGTPLHNPREKSADWHLGWWHKLLDMFPPARGIRVA